MSLNQIQSVDSIISIHKMFGDRFQIGWSKDESSVETRLVNVSAAEVILGSDLVLLDGKIMSVLLDSRLPSNIQSIDEEHLSIEWRQPN